MTIVSDLLTCFAR